MPCLWHEEFAQGPEEPNLATQTKQQLHDWAHNYNVDIER